MSPHACSCMHGGRPHGLCLVRMCRDIPRVQQQLPNNNELIMNQVHGKYESHPTQRWVLERSHVELPQPQQCCLLTMAVEPSPSSPTKQHMSLRQLRQPSSVLCVPVPLAAGEGQVSSILCHSGQNRRCSNPYFLVIYCMPPVLAAVGTTHTDSPTQPCLACMAPPSPYTLYEHIMLPTRGCWQVLG